MTKLALKGRVVKTDQIIEQGIAIIDQSKILFVGSESEYNLENLEIKVLEYPKSLIIPGLIDIHVHGNAGFDVMDGTPEALAEISKSLCSYGVTSFLATTMTAPVRDLQPIFLAIKQFQQNSYPYAQLIGVHLEGPWINKKQKGAQKEADIVHPTLEQANFILELIGNQLSVVTLAPELPNSLEVIRKLSEHGSICSIGHSDATLEEVKQGIDAGASHFTHLFNAMRGLHHREPGVVGAALTYDEMTCDIIVDLVHVHPNAIQIVYNAKGRDKLLLISDGMRAVGMKDGQYELGGQCIHVDHHIARLENGSLAGSTLTLNKAVQNMVQSLGIPIVDAVYMASTAPARKLGIENTKGSLEPKKDADIVVLSPEFEPQLTLVRGKIVHQQF